VSIRASDTRDFLWHAESKAVSVVCQRRHSREFLWCEVRISEHQSIRHQRISLV
jgi:hypothetical protein